jgi:hypothetical protein
MKEKKGLKIKREQGINKVFKAVIIGGTTVIIFVDWKEGVVRIAEEKGILKELDKLEV